MEDTGGLLSLIEITKGTIYIMGVSFILGSLFTIFLLLILEMMRASKEKKEGDSPKEKKGS